MENKIHTKNVVRIYSRRCLPFFDLLWINSNNNKDSFTKVKYCIFTCKIVMDREKWMKPSPGHIIWKMYKVENSKKLPNIESIHNKCHSTGATPRAGLSYKQSAKVLLVALQYFWNSNNLNIHN